MDEPTRLSRRALLAGALLAVPGRAMAQATPTPVQRIPSIRIAVPSVPDAYDPTAAVSLEGRWLSTLTFDAPLRWDGDGTIVDGLLRPAAFRAESLVHDYVLRDRVTFADGTPITADDVRYTLERIRNAGPRGQHGWRLDSVARIESPTDRSIRITLEHPDASLPAMLAHPAFGVVRAGDDRRSATIGTGPFAPAGKDGRIVRYVRNTRFWEYGRPHIERLEVSGISDDAQRSTAIASGDVELVPNVPLLDVAMLQQEPTVYLVGGPSARVCYLQCNVRSETLASVDLRRLLATAMDRASLAKAATGGQAIPTSLLFARTTWEQPENPELDAMSSDEVRAGLSALGIHTDLRLRLLTDNADAMLATTAVVLQDQFARCGIALTVDLREGQGLQDARSFGDFDLVLDVTNPWRDPHELVRPLLFSTGIQNLTGGAVAAMDSLIDSAIAVTIREARALVYGRIEREMIRDGSTIVLFRPHYFDAVSTRLADYRLLPPITSRGLMPVTRRSGG